jgi:hypothetical protein
MIANIASDDALILPHRANPAGLNFRERQAVAQNQKREQSLEGQGRNHTQIDGGDRLRVVSKECLPALRRRRPTPHHVFGDRRLGDLEPQHRRHRMSIDVADVLGLDRGCVHDYAEFHHFIRSRDVPGTKADHANGRQTKNASSIHDVILPISSRLAYLAPAGGNPQPPAIFPSPLA